MRMELVDCRVCHGSGKLPSPSRRCPRCKPGEKPCFACKGRGKVLVPFRKDAKK